MSASSNTTSPIVPSSWCELGFFERRELLARLLFDALGPRDYIREIVIESGPLGREYDLTAAVHTDAGVLRTPLWSHARAEIFCDPSIHEANRSQLSPAHAVEAAADRLRRRLEVRYSLESRGLTIRLEPEDGVERTWTSERALFRNRTAVTREDVVANAAGDIDVRDLLAHFYTGPSVRVVGDGGEPFLLREGAEVEGELVALCHSCGRWSAGDPGRCPHCDSPVDVVIAARAARRTD